MVTTYPYRLPGLEPGSAAFRYLRRKCLAHMAKEENELLLLHLRYYCRSRLMLFAGKQRTGMTIV